IKKTYNKYKDGLIVTLSFHIIIFFLLNINEFKVKKEFFETEMIIDLSEEEIINDFKKQEKNSENNNDFTSRQKTNVASNTAADPSNDFFDESYQRELEEARNLAKDVSQQLSKEIPTIDDLQMPEETTEGINPDSILNNLYSGESNIEYYLEERYHTRLPIPVYLSHYGGKVKVNITVTPGGKVIDAKPVITKNSNEQLLSYAKTAALRTRFNRITASKGNQKGYIEYQFVAQ
ncbi:MAG TPA: hypothetical protein VJ909_01670, partial [Prolixibacteraceae bacterium]|nr:hypothetical protein [Prolixibacteraceae bacterium]